MDKSASYDTNCQYLLSDLYDANLFNRFIRSFDIFSDLDFFEFVVLNNIFMYVTCVRLDKYDEKYIKNLVFLHNSFELDDIYFNILVRNSEDKINNAYFKDTSDKFYSLFLRVFLRLLNRDIIKVSSIDEFLNNKDDSVCVNESNCSVFSYCINGYYLDKFMDFIFSSLFFCIIKSRINILENKSIIDYEINRLHLFKKLCSQLFLDESYKTKLCSEYNLSLSVVNDIIKSFLKHLVDNKIYHNNYKDMINHLNNYINKNNYNRNLYYIFRSNNNSLDFMSPDLSGKENV